MARVAEHQHEDLYLAAHARVGVVLPPSARFDADDLLDEAGTTQNPFRIADRQEIAIRFEEAQEHA